MVIWTNDEATKVVVMLLHKVEELHKDVVTVLYAVR